jgi:hypothetical protein
MGVACEIPSRVNLQGLEGVLPALLTLNPSTPSGTEGFEDLRHGCGK